MSSTVSLSGTTVTKQGSDASLNYVLFVGQGNSIYPEFKSNNGKVPLILPNANLKTFLDEANIEHDRLDNFCSSSGLGLKWTGSGNGDPQSKNVNMPIGMLQDNRINLQLSKKSKIEALASRLQDEAPDTTFYIESSSGAKVFECKFDSSSKKLEGKIYVGVVGWSTYTGEIDSNAPDPTTTPDEGSVSFSSEGYGYEADIIVCAGISKCKDFKTVMTKKDFKSDGVDQFRSKKKYKVTESTLKEIGTVETNGEYSGSSDTFFYLFGSTEDVCEKTLKIDRVCSRLENVKKSSDTSGLKALVKDSNYRLYKTSTGNERNIPDGCANASCTADAKYKKPIYEALAKHLAAAGFSQIVDGSFNPVEARYLSDPGNPDGSETYTFVGYDLSGQRAEIHNIASTTSTIVDVKDKKVSLLSKLLPDNANRLKRDPITGELEGDAAFDLAFATTEDDVQKAFEKHHHNKNRAFTETVYANVIKESVWKMADIWRQTARLTLRKPKGNTIAELEAIDKCTSGQTTSVNVGGKTIYCDKILVNGGQESVDAYISGTDLQLEEQLFSVFESYAAAAGYKFAQERVEFALDMAYSQSNDENGITQSVVGSGYIKLKDIISCLKTTNDDDEFEQAVKDSITIDTGSWNIQDGVYNVHDISVKYSANFWNNWTLDFGFDPFVDSEDGEAWDTFKAAASWKMKEGKMLTLSAAADGSLGLDASWRIDPKDPDTYAQQNIAERLSSLEGAIIQSGLIWDPQNREAKLSASLSKNLSEAINASISLTDAQVTVALDDQYGGKGKWYGNIDLAFTANFGVDLTGLLNAEEERQKESVYENGDPVPGGNSFDLFKTYASASLDITQKKNLLTLGNNLGRIAFEGHTLVSAGQMTGAIQGIKMTSITQWNVVYQNNLVHEIFGLPMNIHPTFGGAIGFSMHNVKSSYFGSEYKGYKFSVGLGVFGFVVELHSRKKVIEKILQRKKYASKIPILGNILGFAKYERDQDYVARAWPCLVYNIINWAKEDFQNKEAIPAFNSMKANIWKNADWKNKPGNCEILKNLPDIGITFSDYHSKYFSGMDGFYLNETAQNFYQGGYEALSQETYGPYDNRDINGYDRWDHWIDGDNIKAGRASAFPTASHAPVWWTVHAGNFVSLADAQAHGAKETDLGAAPTITITDESLVKDKWVDQNGKTLDKTHVQAVRQANATNWSDFPNLKFVDQGVLFQSGDANYLNSAQFAYMYYLREKSFGSYPCKNLFIKWKKWYVQEKQFPFVNNKIDRELFAHGNALTNEINGLTKEVTTTDSLFDQLWGWLSGKKGTPMFDVEQFAEDNKTIPILADGTGGGPLAGAGNTVGAVDNQKWLEWDKFSVTTDEGISTSMYMLTKETVADALADKRDKNTKDPNSAVELYYAHQDWGIVKAYFTYMAPLGEHEPYKQDGQGKNIKNPFYDLPYDPRTSGAVTKREEVRQRNNDILNQTVFDIDYWNGKSGRFDIDYEVNNQPAYRDEFGNTRIEMFKTYRPGWVYTSRGTNTTGEIVWVVPVRGDLYKHEYYFDFKENQTGYSVKKAANDKKVTDACTPRKKGIAGWIVNAFSVFTRFFGSKDYFTNAYRLLPWVYTDSTNAAAATVYRARMGNDRFEYYPQNKFKNLPYPPQGSNISYQEVPWKANNNSSYLDFYEFMQKVELDARIYFFPEYLDNIDADVANSFCERKTKTVRALGILKDRYILEKADLRPDGITVDGVTCKACNSGCDDLDFSSGKDASTWHDGLGEIVGLRSMIGEHTSPSDDLNVNLSESLSYTTNRPWSEQMLNPADYGNLVNYMPVIDMNSKDSNTKLPVSYILIENTTFTSLRDKFSYALKRIANLRAYLEANKNTVFNSPALSMVFTNDQTFVYPDNRNANRLTYTYKQGESISNSNEIASLQRKIEEFLDSDIQNNSKRLTDISYNYHKYIDDFRFIAGEPKHTNLAGEHKYTDLYVNKNPFTANANMGKEGSYNHRSSIALEINALVKEYKDIAKVIASNQANPIASVLSSKSGVNKGENSTYVPTKLPDDSFIYNKYLEPAAAVVLQTNNGEVGKRIFGNQEAFVQPELDMSYVEYSMDSILKFMNIYSKMEWIFGKKYDPKKYSAPSRPPVFELFGGIENPNSRIIAEKQSASHFYDKVQGDLAASYYMMSAGLSGWTKVAMDVISAYWSGTITYGECIWHLNRRLWPLMCAMNQASPKIYVNKKAFDNLNNNFSNYLTELESTMGINITNSPVLSRDFYQGLSFSSLNQQGTDLRQVTDFTYTLDDILFVHRDNVLRLLFNVQNVTSWLKSGAVNYSYNKRQTLFAHSMPMPLLAWHQFSSNEFNRALVDPNYTIQNASDLKIGDLIISSLCKPVNVDDAFNLNEAYRPNGRNRFDTDSSSIVNTSNLNEITTRIFGDDNATKKLLRLRSYTSSEDTLKTQFWNSLNYTHSYGTNVGFGVPYSAEATEVSILSPTQKTSTDSTLSVFWEVDGWEYPSS